MTGPATSPLFGVPLAWPRTVRLRPTPLGVRAVLFHAVLLTTFFAVPYSNLFFVGIAFLSVVAVGNLAWAAANLRGVDAVLAALPPCAAGAPVHLPVAIRGSSGRRRYGIAARIDVAGGHGRSPGIDFDGGEAAVVVQLPPLPRGIHRLTAVGVESTCPYGLLRAVRTAASAAELVVHPAPVAMADQRRRSRRQLLASLLPQQRSAGDVGAASVRDWRTGDEPRRVHWKASARRGELVVREPDDDDGSGREIVLDRRCPPDVLETALSVVTTLALAAAETKEALTLHTQGSSATYGAGAATTSDLLRLLATLQPLAAGDPAPPPAPSGAVCLPHREAR